MRTEARAVALAVAVTAFARPLLAMLALVHVLALVPFAARARLGHAHPCLNVRLASHRPACVLCHASSSR